MLRRTLNIITALALTSCSDSLEAIHANAIRHHVYVTDPEQYGVEDKWVASLVGDCEDYALWMRERVGGELILDKI